MELHERIARARQALGVSADYLLLGKDTEQMQLEPVPAEKPEICP